MRLLAGHNLAQRGDLLVGHGLADVVGTITASVPILTSPLVVGDTLADTANWSAMLNPATYSSADPADAGANPAVVVNYIGDTANAN